MIKRKSPMPTMEELTDYLKNAEGKVGKRELARAFNIKGDNRIALKSMLKEMQDSGIISKYSRNQFSPKGRLAENCQVEITGEDSDGFFVARPLHVEEGTPSPQIIIKDVGNITPGIKIGDIVVAKLKQIGQRLYEGKIIRRITNAPDKIVGIFITRGKGLSGQVSSVDRRLKYSFYVAAKDTLNAVSGSIVVAEIVGKLNNKVAKITKIIAKETDSNVASLISIYQHSIPFYFPKSAIEQAEKAKLPTMDKREDLRHLPLITIDGEDARDFDDAVFAEPDKSSDNKGGWHLIIAIADVAYFARQGTPLDISARERGNSVYFPDQAIHMFPEELATGLSSLAPNEDRPCLVAHIRIDKEGKQKDKKFTRAMIRSAYRLNYHEVEDIINGKEDKILSPIINNLFESYKLLDKQRDNRGALNLETEEKEVILNDKGTVIDIKKRERLQSHKIIEEFMIMANVAAAQVLEDLNMPVIYRIHDKPSPEKLDAFLEALKASGIKAQIAKEPKPSDFNRILNQVKDTPNAFNINEMVLRSQSQAQYSTENIGHFGLALERYAHFTSPIRRYADLMVHRALISGLKLGEGGLDMSKDIEKYLADTAEHISFTERRADIAEREAEDRYVASFLHNREGEVFKGIVTGVSAFGLFIRLNENGAEGLAPISTLPDEYYVYDDDSFSLVGQNTGKTYRLGTEVEVVLKEVTPITGGILLEVIETSKTKKYKSNKRVAHNHKRTKKLSHSHKPRRFRRG